ncbi:hypothetical protein [Sphingopyxis sp. DBS4]|uniref:hypothetical protein n=1 Tax=Sphingopyxis sp. DBS4 TaxID=2968500 RepID=UPI00214BA9F7|nr:hypothetical protein [Sphingopyxis sp. DBS4]
MDDARLGRKAVGQEKWLDWNLFAEKTVVLKRDLLRHKHRVPLLVIPAKAGISPVRQAEKARSRPSPG